MYNLIIAFRCVHSSTQHKAAQSSTEKPAELRALYLDAQATNAVDPRVLDAMMPYMIHQYGNPHSRTHSYGWETETAVENARQVVNIFTDELKQLFYHGLVLL